MEIKIEIDFDEGQYVLLDCADELKRVRRLLVGLRRLQYHIEGANVCIPYDADSKISTLDEVRRLLLKHGFTYSLSKEADEELDAYEREIEFFKEFSEKARSIRNDEFENKPELVERFEQFTKVIDTRIIRTLYELQNLAAFHMAFSQHSCNFAVPGAGKTTIVYAAFAYLNSLACDDPRRVDKLLVVSPLSAFAPWENEFKACFGREPTSQRLSGDARITRAQKEQHLYSGDAAELTLVFHGGVSLLQSEIVDFLRSNKTMVVVDEAHRIKNPDGVWGRSAIEIAKEARSRVVLTGTPVPNGYEDLLNLFQYIYPYKYKDILGFNFASLMEMSEIEDSESSNALLLKENISPYFIRIKKKDLDLPAKHEHNIEIDMDDQQREIYDFIESAYIRSFSKNSSATIKDVINRAKLIRLRQAATNPALLKAPLLDALENSVELGEVDPNSKYLSIHDGLIDDSEFFHSVSNYEELCTPNKFLRIKELLDEIIGEDQDKCIIWTIFIQNAKSLGKYLLENSYDSKLLIGEVEQEEREGIIKKFNDPDNQEFRIVIANPFSVSESISLHKGCHHAIYLERDYNCSNFLQSKDRIHRVGLEKHQQTHYYYLVSKDSIDSVIDDKLRQKVERMEAMINEDIPLFSRINDDDETDIIKGLLKDYARRAL